jgi:MFS family permease
VVLPILVFQRTGSALLTSSLTAIEVAPYLLIGLLAGVIADRGDRRRLMVGCDLAQVVLLASVPIAAAAGILTTPHLFVVAATSATVFVWFDAANFGALPALVGRDHVVAASSAMWTFDSLALIAGPALGAGIAAATDPAFALGVDAVTYLASALLLTGITRPFEVPRDDRQHATWMADLREGLQYLWRDRVMRALTLAGFGNSLSFGAVLGLTVVIAVERLGVGSHDARLGLLFSANALGGLAAAAALPRLTHGRPAPRVSAVTLHAAFGATVAIAFVRAFPLAIGLWVVWGFVVQVTILNGIAYRQQVTPDHLQSRVNVVARMLAWGGQPLGAAIGGALAALLDVRTAILVTSAAVGVAAVAAGRPLWRAARV